MNLVKCSDKLRAKIIQQIQKFHLSEFRFIVVI